MGMHKSVYIGPYIKAKLEDEEKQAPTNWYAQYDEGGDEELCSGEVFIPDGKERKEVGGWSLYDESGVFELPPRHVSPPSALEKALARFRETDPTASLHYGIIVTRPLDRVTEFFIKKKNLLLAGYNSMRTPHSRGF